MVVDMTVEEAYRILGISKEADNKTIKLQFRKLIAKYHPDAVGSDAPEHLKKAQLLNEAYALLRKRAAADKNSVNRKPVWKAKVVETAFTQRTVYMSGVSWEGETPELYQVARGRYEWDPDLEEFECFLRSLNEAVMELLERTEEKNGIYNFEEYDVKAQRFDCQLQLFHLLAGQFISPVSCMKKLTEPEETDEQGRNIYKFQAFLGTTGTGDLFSAMSKLKEGDLLYATSLKNNRIMVSNAAGTKLGHLSLADDCLYYVIIPILQNRMAQVKFLVKECNIHRRSRPYRIKVNVELYLRMGKEVEDVKHCDWNLKIGEVLNWYEEYLKRIRK